MNRIRSIAIVTGSLLCALAFTAAVAMAEKPIHPGYPFVFDMQGTIDRIAETELVLDDVLCEFTSGTTFHAPDLIFSGPSDFKTGDQVGLMLGDGGKREVLSVWLIERPED